MKSSLPILVAVLLTITACSEAPAASQENRTNRGTAVAAFELEPTDLARTLRATGTVEPRERIELRSLAAGVLTRLDVEVGQAVTPGQLVAAVDLTEARAELARAEAAMEHLQREVERRRPLVDQGAVLRAELEEQEADLEVRKRELDLWRTRIALGQVRAPRAGVVIARHVDPGSSVGPQDLLLEIIDLDDLILPVGLSERDVVHLEEGHPADVRFDAHPDQSFSLPIRRIHPRADPESRRVIVELSLSELPTDLGIRPGFLGRATFEIDRRTDVLAIPTEALLASEGDDVFVYVIEDDTLHRRDVLRGVARANRTEIVEGLQAGDVIVGTNPTNLREGTEVRITQWVQ